MKKVTVQSDFKMSYSALMQLGDKAVSLITRDSVELAAYGVDAVAQQFIIDNTQALKDFPTDEELEGLVSDATEVKDKTADDQKVAVRSIMVRVKNGFGEKSGKFRRFGTKGMDDMNDNDLLKCGKRVLRVATIFQPALASKGLTVAMITALNIIVTKFDNDIDVQDDAIRVRDIATEDRLELGNLLYNKIAEVFDFGKDHWVTKDESKYNDYVIYDTPAPGITGIKGEVINTATAAPEPDVTIHLQRAGEQFTALSNAQGKYLIELAPGDYSGFASKDGFDNSAAVTIVVTQGNTTPQKFLISPIIAPPPA